jgi:argininosuccinate lyase
MIGRVSFNRERMREAASDELIAATDLADLLVRLGTPFREAHGVVAGLVRTALDSGRTLSQLTPEELGVYSPTLAEHAAEYYEVLSQGSWLESKISEGGTSLTRVAQQLALAKTVLDEAPSA